MVAIVSGNSLGLSLTSLATLGQRGVQGAAAGGRNGELTYVNVATGNLVLQDRDDRLSAHGLGFDGVRTYNSLGQFTDDNGDNWNPALVRRVYGLSGTIFTVGSTVTRRDEDGAEAVFQWNAGTNRYESLAGAGALDFITYDSTNQLWYFTDGASGMVERYDGANGGRLNSISDTAGNTLSLSFNADGVMSQVNSSSGEKVYYDYNASKQVTQIRVVKQGGAIVTRVRYGYDTSNRLSTVTVDLSPDDNSVSDAKTYVTTYAYDGTSKRVAGVTQSDGSSLGITYVLVGTDYRVKTVTNALNQTTTFDYDTASRRTTVTDPLSLKTLYDYDAQGQLVKVTAPPVNGVSQISSFAYNANGDLTQVIDGAGHVIDMSYDARGNQVRQTDSAGNTVLRTYDARNHLLSETISSLGSFQSSDGVTIADGTIVKTGGADASWDSGFWSRIGYVGSASVSFVVPQTTKGLAVGLNSDPTSDSNIASIDWAILCRSNGTLAAYENGGLLQELGSYAAGDALAVTYDGSSIRYLKNGTALLTITRTTPKALFADSSFFNTEATISRLRFSDISAADFPTGAINVSSGGGVVKKISGVDGTWDSAYHTKYGYSNGAYVSFSPAQINKALMVGLNTDPTTDSDYASLDWALYCRADGTLAAFENGSLAQELGTYSAGDSLSISYDGATIRYVKNGVVVKTSTAAISAPLFLDSSFKGLGASVTGLQFGGNSAFDLSTRYVYDAGNKGQLRFVISPEGRVTEYRYNVTGERSTSVRYAGGTYALPGLGGGVVPTEAQMVVWANAQDLTRTTRIDSTYDIRGQLQQSTAYSNVDGTGNGVLDGTQSVTQYVYDQAGLLLKTIAPDTGVTVYTYDGLGRVLTATDSQNQTAITVYDDASNKTRVTLANGLITSTTYDRGGRKVSVQQSSAGTADLGNTTYFYDADGRLRMTQDPTGTKTYALYDEAGRKVADIDSDGSLTEFVYNGADQIFKTIRYATAVNVSLLVDAAGQPANISLAAVRPAGTTYITRDLYDSAGRLAKHIDELGYVTETRYDGASRVVATIRYDNVLSSTSLAAITASTQASDPIVRPMSAIEDRWSRFFYDNDGRCVAALDGEGYLTTNVYDGEGRMIHTVSYATQTNSAYRISGTLAQLRPAADGARDIHTWNYYDAQDRLIATVDGEGYMTENVYDANGNKIKSVRYATRATPTPQSITAATLLTSLRPAVAAKDQISSWAYDHLNRLTSFTDAEGTVTQYTYDSSGRLVASTRATGTTEARTRTSIYDPLGRLTGELNGEGTAALAALGSAPTQAQVDAVWASYGIRHAYDLAGRRISSTDAAGNKTLFYYDTDNRVRFTVDASGGVEEQQYNTLNQRTATIRYAGRIALSGLSGGLVNAAITNAVTGIKNSTLDSKISYLYTSRGEVRTITDATGLTRSTQYNAYGEALAVSTKLDATRVRTDVLQHDKRGLLTSTERDIFGPIVATTESEYDAFGRLIKTTDANGNTHRSEYDRLGRVIQTRDASDGITSVTTYDAFSRVLTKTDGVNQTIYAYDDAARSVNVTTPEGVKMTTVHNRNGERQSITDGRGKVTSYQYDLDGNLVQTNAPEGAVSKQSFDHADRLFETTDARGFKVRYTYTAQNKVWTRQVDPTGLNLTTTYSYDGKGQQVSETDPTGLVTRIEYNLNGQLQSKTVDYGGLNLKTSFTYDGSGQVVTMTSPTGIVTAYTYDTLGRRIREQVDPTGLNLTKSYTYDGNGNVVTRTDENGNLTRYVYDKEDRLVFTVDALGNTTRQDYNWRGEVVGIHRFARPIDLTGLPLAASKDEIWSRAILDVNDTEISKVYDRDGHLRFDVNRTTSEIVEYRYDGNGNATDRIAYATRPDLSTWISGGTNPPVVVDALRDERTRTVFDGLNRPLYTVDGTGAVTRSFYDGNGNVIKRIAYANRIVPSADPSTVVASGSDHVSVFVYDSANRLTWSADASGAVTGLVYDKDGRIVKRTQYATPITAGGDPSAVVPNANDRVTSMAYDKAGRLRYEVNPEGGVTEYQYTSAGQVNSRTDYSRKIDLSALAQPATASDIASRLAPQAADDRTTRSFYDAAGRLRFEIDALGYASETRYLTDRTLSIRYAAAPSALSASASTADVAAAVALIANALADQQTEQRFDPAGRSTDAIDANGTVTRQEYDGIGRVLRITQAVGLAEQAITTYSYDGAGRVLSKTTAQGTASSATSLYQYDGIGRLVKETDPRGYALANDNNAWAQAERPRLGYPQDASALTSAQRDALLAAFSTSHNYDAGGHRTSTVNAQGATTVSSYDAFGNAVKVVDPAGNAGYFYFDKLNRVDLHVDPEGYATQTVYANSFDGKVQSVRRYFAKVAAGTNEAARPTLATNALDAVTSYEYDRLGRIKRSTDAAGATETVEYEVSGNRFSKRITNKLGGATTFQFDKLGRQTSETLPVQSRDASNTFVPVVNAYTYDAFGNRTQTIEAQGLPEQRTTVFRFDKQGRVTHRIGTAYSAFDAVSQTWTTVTPVEYTRYDALGRVIESVTGGAWTGSAVQGGSHSFSYYDAAGNEVARVAADGAYTALSYSPSGKIWRERAYATRVTLPATAGGNAPTATADSANDRVTTSLYDRVDRLIETRRDAVIHWEQPTNVDTITLSLPSTQPETITLQRLVYDAAGHVVQEIDARGNSAYNYYDKLGRKVLRIDQEGYATAWDFSDLFDTATQETRYATRVPQYARQDDLSAAAALRDPAALRLGLSASTDRITQFTLNRAGAVTEKRTKNVAFEYVDSAGTRTQRATDAVTTFSYDGLGHVTQQQERVAELSDNVTNVWNTTDIKYDKLGREIQRQAPGYTDYLGASVRPITDTEYDGLGNISRTIQRGTDNSTESDDRITAYKYNANGDRIQQTDAAGNVTVFDLDSQGQVARSTVKAVKDADGGTRDVVKLYQYDALGRNTVQTDAGTGEVRKTSYNAFGEISGKSLGDGWQEFTLYNTLGKVQKTNTVDGVTKIFLYDSNGNTAREIRSSTVDLTNVSVLVASQDTSLQHTFSAYDKRNQLIKTVEPDISFMRDKVSMQQAFTQQLADLYGPLSVVNSSGGTYAGGNIDNTGYVYTQVSGSNSAVVMPDAAPITTSPSLTFGAYGTPSSLPTTGAFALQANFSSPYETTAHIKAKTQPVPFTLPSSFPAAPYRLLSNVGAVLRYPMTPGGTYSLPATTGNSYFLLQMGMGPTGTNWVTVSTLHVNTMWEPDYDGWYWVTQGWDCTNVAKVFVPPVSGGAVAIYASINSSGANRQSIPVTTFTDYTGGTVPGYYAVDTSGLANGTYTILLESYDAYHNRVTAENLTVVVKNGAAITQPPSPLAASDAWVVCGNSPYLRSINFNRNAVGGDGTGTLYVRPKGTPEDWRPLTMTGAYWIDIARLALPRSQNYEFILNTGSKETHGEFYLDGDEVPQLAYTGMLQSITRSPRTLNFDLNGRLSDTGAGSYVMELSIGGASLTKALTGWNVSFDVASELSALGVSNYASNNFSYNYRVYGIRGGIRQFVGQGSGSIKIGSDFVSTNNGTQSYRPTAILSLPSGSSLSGSLTLRPEDNINDVVSVGASGDWRRTAQSANSIGVDLSQWFIPGSTRLIDLSYDAGDAKFTGTYRLNGNGSVDCLGITCAKRQPKIPISIAGATRLSVLSVGASDSTLGGVAISSRVSTSGSTFTWDASDQAGLGVRRFYYEAVDANGQLIGKGYGSFTLAADGTLTYSVDTPQLLPSVFRFTTPSTATSFELRVRPKGSSAAYTVYNSLTVDGSARVFDATALRPGSGLADYECLYVGKDGSGATVSSGSGTLTIQSNGVTSASLTEDRKPTLVTLRGPTGKSVARLQFDMRVSGSANAYTTVILNGTWSSAQNCSLFTWDASANTPVNGTASFDYVLRMQNSDGSAFKNEVGDPIEVAGLMTLGGSLSTPVQMKQYVTQLNQSAQVRHMQSFNAFGEISEEYDDRTLQRAQDMVGLYGGTVDASAVKTTFAYNTLGKLVTKTDPQTHITLANGYRYRDRPITRYGYDLAGRLTTVTDANGNLSKQSFTGEGERLGVQWAADGGRKKTEYDAFGSARKLTDELNAVTLQDTDKLGNLTKVQRLGITRVENFVDSNAVASTLTDTYDYDAFGQRIKHTNTLGWVEKTYFDNIGRITRSTSAEGRATTYGYTFVAAGAAGGIISNGGKNLGGWQLTTTTADGRSTVDKTDYFGHTTWHQDEGARTYAYTYDIGGHLASQTSSAGQNIQYSYYANGYIKEAKDLTERTLSRYGYDNAGNRVWEAYSGLDASNTMPVGSYQDTAIAYDELNRMSRVKDLGVDIQYEYDAVGNRRAVHSVYWDPVNLGTRRRDDFWYTYDAANRFTMTKGSFAGTLGTSATDTRGSIVQGTDGVVIGYNQASQRISAKNSDGSQETYSYSADGFLEDTRINGVLRARRRVDSLGRTLNYKEWQADGSTISLNKTSQYDKDNRLLRDSTGDGTTDYYYFNDTSDTQAGALQYGSGALARADFSPASPGTSTSTTYTYQYWDSAKQLTIKKQASNESAPGWAPGLSNLSYDTNGFLKRAIDTKGGRTLQYFNNATGLALRRDEIVGANTYSHFWYYAAGRRVGDVTTDPNDTYRVSYAESLAQGSSKSDKDRFKNFTPVTSADFDQNYEPINPSYPAATGTAYTVRSGDTLKSIAQAVWGDSAMWYLIAQANDLSGKETLVAGQLLVIPNKVTNIHNNAQTFRPYNPGEVIGHIDPTLPAPPPAPHHGCGTIGVVLMIAVAVVVTIYTAGAAASMLAPSTTVAAGTTGLSATMSLGASVLSGTAASAGITTGIGLASAAIGGAVGSIASQLVGKAAGVVDHFQWKQVSYAAIGSMVTAGVGEGLSAAAETAKLGSLTNTLLNTSPYVRAAVAGAASSAITQAIHGHWNWREVAASAVGSAAGQAAGKAVDTVMRGSDYAGIAGKLASGFGNAWASNQVRATDPNYTRARSSSMFISSLGNALGDSIVDNMRPGVSYSQAEADSDSYREKNRFAAGVELNASAVGDTYTGGQRWADAVAAGKAANAQRMAAALNNVGKDVTIDSSPGVIYAQKGDTLDKIARRWAPDGNSASQIYALRDKLAAANPQLTDTNHLDIGQQLNYLTADTIVDRAAAARIAAGDTRYFASRTAKLVGPQQVINASLPISSLGFTSLSPADGGMCLRPEIEGLYRPPAEARPLELRERFLGSMANALGNTRGGNVAVGFTRSWLYFTDNVVNGITNAPSAITGMVSSLWEDPLGTIGSGVGHLRTNFRSTVYGDGQAMGSFLFNLSTAPLQAEATAIPFRIGANTLRKGFAMANAAIDDALTFRTGPFGPEAISPNAFTLGQPTVVAPKAVDFEPVLGSSNKGYLFRGDTRPPSRIFHEGFEPVGGIDDLLEHAGSGGVGKPSNYVATSMSPNVAREFGTVAGGEGWVYTLRQQPNGIDVNATLGKASPFPNELEVAVPGTIYSEDILGARKVINGRFVGPFVKNPWWDN